MNYISINESIVKYYDRFRLVVGKEVFSSTCYGTSSRKGCEIEDKDLIELRDFLNMCFPENNNKDG